MPGKIVKMNAYVEGSYKLHMDRKHFLHVTMIRFYQFIDQLPIKLTYSYQFLNQTILKFKSSFFYLSGCRPSPVFSLIQIDIGKQANACSMLKNQQCA